MTPAAEAVPVDVEREQTRPPRRNLKRAIVVGVAVALGVYFTPYESVQWKSTFDGQVNIACVRQAVSSERFAIEEENSSGQVINLRARALPARGDVEIVVVEPRGVQVQATWVVERRPDEAGKVAIRAAMVVVLDSIGRSCGATRALT